MSIPDEPATPTPASTNDDEYILQVRSRKNSVNPTTPDSNSRLIEKEEQHEVILPTNGTVRKQVKETKKPASKPVVIKQEMAIPKATKPKQEPKQEPLQTVNPDKEDTGIYFDDGFGEDITPTPTTKKKEKELEEIDLEDEYYDLDGF